MTSFKSIRRLLLILTLSILIIACSKINQSNFEKIKTGMTLEEVTRILGNPTSAESIDISGISGTSAVWKSNSIEIDIQFLNNKVTVKSFSKLEVGQTD